MSFALSRASFRTTIPTIPRVMHLRSFPAGEDEGFYPVLVDADDEAFDAFFKVRDALSGYWLEVADGKNRECDRRHGVSLGSQERCE